MSERLREFIAEDAWLFFGVVTLPIGILTNLLGSEAMMLAVFVLGWFLLCPILLFWGEVVADLLGVDAPDEPSEPIDPIDELKARYARGDIDEAEFENRLSVLLETEGHEERTTARAEEVEPSRS